MRTRGEKLSAMHANQPAFESWSLENKDNQTPAPRSQSGVQIRDFASTCATLRSALPSYDNIISAFACNGFWWHSFHQKAYAISESPAESLEEFAQRTYTSSHPADLGALAIAVARSSSDHRHLYSLVDDVIISNLTYIATVEGIECVILLAKSYTDGGQPKRAWLIWRKGLAAAQLMVWFRFPIIGVFRLTLI